MSAQPLLRESVWGRAKGDTEKAFHTARFWAAEVIALAIGGAISGAISDNPWVGAGGAVISAFGLVAFLFVVSLVLAPYRQRNEARRHVGVLQRREKTLIVEPRVHDNVAYLWVRNDGDSNEFQVSVEELRGAKIRERVQIPYYAPWMSLTETIPKGEEMTKRRGRTLMNGASDTVIIASLMRRQTDAPHHLFQFWNTDHSHGSFFVNAVNDDQPQIEIAVAVLSSTTEPRRETLLMQADNGKLSLKGFSERAMQPVERTEGCPTDLA